MLLIEDRLEAARSHLAAGRTDSAVMILENILDHSPTSIAALKELASARFRMGEVQKAHTLATEAAARAAGDPEVLCLLARTSLLSEKVEQAVAALDQALAIDPAHPEASKLKATILAQRGDRQAAEKLLRHGLENHPDDPDLLAALSATYLESGLAAPALELSQQALELAPDRADLLALVGEQLAELGDNEKALGFIERAHLQEPANAVYLIRLADAQAGAGELTEAHRTAKRGIALFPNLLSAWASYVRIMIFRGEAQSALAEFVPVAKRHPDRTAALLTLAATYRIAGDPAQALRLMEPVIRQLGKLKPEQKFNAMALMRDCCLSLGMFDQIAATLPDLDLHAALGLPAGAGSNAALLQDPELVEALDRARLVVDPGLSILEAMTLLRFRLGADTPDRIADIHGPSGLAEIIALMDNARFSPTDEPVNGDAADQAAIPLSYVLALPEAVRGGIAAPLPYMRAPEERRKIWRRSLQHLPRPLVALAWDQGRPGLLLEDYRPLIEGFQGTLVSVMWDESRHQLASWPTVIDAGVHFTSLADLAAVIAETDAIIGPDGIPLHVAGAMGRPGALLTLPNMPWYWHAEDNASVWYPSIAVLTTRSFGSWAARLPELLPGIEAFLQGLGQASTAERNELPLRQTASGSN